MRIVCPGIFIAAAWMKPISEGGFWIGFLALLSFAGVLWAVRDLVRYIRLRRHGVRVKARIVSVDKGYGYKGLPQWTATYIYRINGVPYQNRVSFGFPYRKYSSKKKLDICYDPDEPFRHIIVPNTLWQCIGGLFLAGLFFGVFFCCFSLNCAKAYEFQSGAGLAFCAGLCYNGTVNPTKTKGVYQHGYYGTGTCRASGVGRQTRHPLKGRDQGQGIAFGRLYAGRCTSVSGDSEESVAVL